MTEILYALGAVVTVVGIVIGIGWCIAEATRND